MIEDKALSAPLAERYAGWDSDEAKAMLSGKRSLEDIAARVASENSSRRRNPAGKSGWRTSSTGMFEEAC